MKKGARESFFVFDTFFFALSLTLSLSLFYICIQHIREEHIEAKLATATQNAKLRLSKGDKKGALFCLKQKKMYEAEVRKLQGAKLTLASQIIILQGASLNVDVISSLNVAQQALRSARGNIEADTVEDIMENLEEEKMIQDEIGEAISRAGKKYKKYIYVIYIHLYLYMLTYILGMEFEDDEDLLRELEELEEQQLEETILQMPTATTSSNIRQQTREPEVLLPQVPSNTLVRPQPQQEEEDEDLAALRALEAEMMG